LLITEAMETFKVPAIAAGLTMSLHFHDNLSCGNVFLHVDAPKIRQVIANLISNAIKFSSTGKTITVDCCLIEITGSDVVVYGDYPLEAARRRANSSSSTNTR
jgi:signal transduction histidine kinase